MHPGEMDASSDDCSDVEQAVPLSVLTDTLTHDSVTVMM